MGFGYRFLFLAAALLPLPFLGGCTPLHPIELGSQYHFMSHFPDGKTAEGTLQLSKVGQTYDMSARGTSWDGKKIQVEGLGFSLDEILGSVNTSSLGKVTYEDLGVAIYRIDGGMLSGFRVQQNDPQRILRKETLSGPALLEGDYDVAATEPPYSPGRVRIRPNGEAFFVTWYSSNQELEYLGVGIRLADKLIVGYSRTNIPGVLAHCQTGADLEGLGAWSTRDRLSWQTLDADPQDQPREKSCLALLKVQQTL